MSKDRLRIPGKLGAVVCATWVFAALIVGLLTFIVSSRRANLTWDDADYLRRALTNTRVSTSAGGFGVVTRSLRCLLRERPKPPCLVAWIQMGTVAFDRQHLDALILFSSVLPYSILLATVVFLGRRLAGPWGGLGALTCLVASPLSLAFGGKVMVETVLSLWVLLIYALTCRLLVHPSRKLGMAIGILVGLAFLTKLTIVLFLPIPLYFALARVIRGGRERAILLKSLVWSVVACAAIAGPWYVSNANTAYKFAQFSSRYNEIAELRPGRDPTARRLVLMAADLPGWPLVATFGIAAVLVALVARSQTPTADSLADEALRDDRGALFSRMAWLGAGSAATILLWPLYFDTRFLMPIWPVVAVDLGRRLAVMLPRSPRPQRAIFAAGLAISVICAAIAVVRAPVVPTYWNTAALIDNLVREYGTATIGNVGNFAEWNVSKSGLANELRRQPATCFVLHDLTKMLADEAQRRLPRFDAVIVLGQGNLSETRLMSSPGLNRSYRLISRILAEDPTFARISTAPIDGLPALSVYVRKALVVRREETSRPSHERRRL
jgi:Dolichyl-phosphate-mannose-protein mannosyltransferase